MSFASFAQTCPDLPNAALEDVNKENFIKCSPVIGPFEFNLSVKNISTTKATNQSYLIEWGDGSQNTYGASFSTATHLYKTRGKFDMKVTVTSLSGCTSSKTYAVYNGTNPGFGLQNIGNTSSCAPATYTFNITGTSNNSPTTAYKIWFDDGSDTLYFNQDNIPASIEHVFESSSSKKENGFTISGVAIDCYNRKTPATISGFVVSGNPKSAFEFKSATRCVDSIIKLKDTSTGGFNPYNPNNSGGYNRKWKIEPATGWSFVNDTDEFSEEPEVIFTASGQYNITLTITPVGNSAVCPGDEHSELITIEDPTKAAFTLRPDQLNSCAPNTFAAQNLSTGTNVAYTWSVTPATGFVYAQGNSTSAHPSFTFQEAGTYRITLTAKNTCGTTTYFEDVTVLNKPTVSLPANAQYCGPQTLVFGPSNAAHTPVYNAQGSRITRYQWSLDSQDGAQFLEPGMASEAYPAIVFTKAGVYQVRVQAWNDCGESVATNQTVTIYALPAAPVVAPVLVCKGTSATLEASGEVTTYKWYASATATSPLYTGVTFTTPVLQTTTTYYVEALSENDCASSSRTPVTVTVQDQPVAPVINSNPAICANSRAVLETAVPNSRIEWFSSATSEAPFFVGNILDTLLTSTTTFYAGSITEAGDCRSLTRTKVTVTVHPNIYSNTITTLSRGICEGSETGIIVASAPKGGFGSPTFQWQMSIDGQTFTDISGETKQNLPSRALTNTTWFRRTVTLGACTENTEAIKIAVVPPITQNVIIAPADFICAGTVPPALEAAPLLGGDGSEPTFIWESSASENGTYTLAKGAGTLTSFQPDALPNSRWFHRKVIINGCESISAPVEIKVNPLSLPPTVSATRSTICSGSTTELKATAPSGPYSWYDAATEGNLLHTGNTFVTPVLTNNTGSSITVTYYVQSEATGGCTVSRTAVKITVESEITNNTILEVARVCAGESPSIRGLVPAGGTGSPVYTWQYSLDAGDEKVFKDATGNTKNSVTYTAANLGQTTWFRRKVKLGTCESYSNTVQVVVTPALANNALPAALKFCEGTTPPQLAGTGDVTGGDPIEGIQYRWEMKTSLADTFGPAPGDNTNATYQPTDITQPNTWFRRVAVSGSCQLESNTLVLQMSPKPALPVLAKTSLEVCVGGGATLNAIPKAGVTFQWFDQAGTLLKTGNSLPIAAADLTEARPYIYYVESKTADGCLSSDRVAVTVKILPLLSASLATGEQSVCMGSAPTKPLTATAPTGGNGQYHYQWQSTTDLSKPFKNTSYEDTLATYLPGELYVHTWFRRVVRSADCETYSNPVRITVDVPVTNNISITQGSAEVCYGVAPTLTMGGPASGGDGKNYRYQWQSRTDASQPFVNTSLKDTLATFQPGATLGNTQYRRLVMSGACEAGASNVLEVFVNPIPTAPIAQNQTICTGSKARLTASGDGTIQWLDAQTGAVLFTTRSGGVFETPVLTTTTVYHVRVVSAPALCVGPVTAVTVVVEEKIRQNTIQGVADVCYATIPEKLIGSTPTGGNGQYEYQWFIKAKNKTTFQEIPGATDKDYQHGQMLLIDTKFKRSVKAGECAEDFSQEIEIKVNMPLAEGTNYITPMNQLKAAGTTPTLLKGSAIPADYTIQWWYKTAGMNDFEPIAGATSRDYQPGALQETTFFMREAKSKYVDCSSFSDAARVTVFKAFTDNSIMAGGQVCYKEPSNFVIKGNEPDGSLTDVQYYWEKKTQNTEYVLIGNPSPATARDFNVPVLDVTTWYRRKVVVNGVATTSNEIKVEVFNKVANNTISANQIVCAGTAPTKLMGSLPTGGSGSYTYVWESSTTSATTGFTTATGPTSGQHYEPSALVRTTWFRRVVLSGTCTSEVSNAVQVTVTPLPKAPVAKDVFLCAGNTVTLTAALAAPATGVVIEWYNQAQGGKLQHTGASFTTPVLQSATTYYVQTVSQSCASERVPVRVNIPEPTANAGQDVTIAYGRFAELTATGGVSYQWSPSIGLNNDKIANPVAKPKTTTTYTVTVTTAEGCTSTDQVTITVLPAVEIPNGFTPNNDGINDNWDIPTLKGYPGAHVEVFNRWGNKVFESKGYQTPWDGTMKGQPLPAATYYYLIRLGGKEEPLSGNVTIIK
ncbi:hypothetical protein GCM10023183_14890 [Nibribacter koreensis]|uniref:PKD domain-containing protein n=1 Tax=Nibribacter koreensis TaxID=1084519 RepID=A0ABP8FFR5_9BACT